MKNAYCKFKIGGFLSMLGIIFIGLSGSGCASIIGQGNYSIQVSSGAPGENCTVNKKATNEVIFRGQTPCTVTLKPGTDDYVFNVNGQEKDVLHKPNPWIFTNLIFGPLFGLGMLVDMSTGHFWEYPNRPLCFN